MFHKNRQQNAQQLIIVTYNQIQLSRAHFKHTKRLSAALITWLVEPSQVARELHSQKSSEYDHKAISEC